MRIVHLAAGAGSMYCGACARDAALVRELIRRGHDVQVVPLYTPLRLEGPDDLPCSPVYLGGINAYLQQVSGLFRHTPRTLDRLLDSERLLRWASRFAVRTSPRDLGPMTVSVLRGQDGFQRKELDRLLDYLSAGPRPDVVCITNSLLSGIAPALKSRLGVPVVCGLQGEETFVAGLPEPYQREARELICRNASAIDLFLSPGEGYARDMADFLGVTPERVVLARAGIDASPYDAAVSQTRAARIVGYLGVITHAKGLDRLLEAFAGMATSERGDLVLRVAGRPLDRGYERAIQRQIDAGGLRGRVEFFGEVDLAGKVRFLGGCSVFVTPTRIAESRGIAVLEAMATGVPVVAPDSGVFPEMLRLTGGGLLYEAGSVEAMASQMAALIDDPDRARRLGDAGRIGVREHYSATAMADAVLAAYGLVAG